MGSIVVALIGGVVALVACAPVLLGCVLLLPIAYVFGNLLDE